MFYSIHCTLTQNPNRASMEVKRCANNTKFITGTILIVLLFVYLYLQVQHLQEVKLAEEDLKSRKTILLATKFFGHKYNGLDGARLFCPKCIYTEDVKYWNRSDALVFHMFDLAKTPPKKPRTSNQIWILFNLESVYSRNWSLQHLKNYANLFNWTMSYRHDSEVYAPYGQIVSNMDVAYPRNVSSKQESLNFGIPTLDELKNKTMAAWIVSQCKTHGKREDLVKQLQKYVTVDIYGKCGEHKCDSSRNYSPQRADCKKKVATQYKFYLALENSICQDYVSEKFFEALRNPIVPIVYGGANYSLLAPSTSYINVNDFESVADLGDHLIWLDQNPREYLKYFEWKSEYWLAPVNHLCAICDALWHHDGSHKTIHSAHAWMFSRSDREGLAGELKVEPSCVKPKKFEIP